MNSMLVGVLMSGIYLLAGVECASDIDECEAHPCENGAACEDGIADYICHCILGPDGIAWGGKNCSVELTGCHNHSCQNEALCVPTLQSGIHGHVCQCHPGFYDASCSTPTTFSFTSSVYLFINMSTENKNAKDASERHLMSVALRFRTTIPDATLLFRGNSEEHLLLELAGGLLRVTLSTEGTSSSSFTLEAPQVDDGLWHKVEVLVGSSLELRLWHVACTGGMCFYRYPLEATPPVPFLASFLHIYIGGVEEDLTAHPLRSFIGCLQDVQIDSKVVIPQEVAELEFPGFEMGCERTEWCGSQPCLNGGQCIDLWADFSCLCSRPYEGHICSYESPTGTFGRDDSSSFASFTVNGSPGVNFNISFFLRTLKPSGLVMQIGNSSEPFLSVYLKDGRLRLEVSSASPTIGPSAYLANGVRNFVMLSFTNGFAHARLLNTEEELGLLAMGPLPAGLEIHVGGLPAHNNTDPWGGHFKGCLQDVRFNQQRLQFFPEALGNHNASEEVHAGESSNIELGCISDDACKPGPCLNGGHCVVTWNDFSCSCPANFTGKHCEDKVWCQSQPCPPGTTCMDVPSGYVCVARATFHEHSTMEFTSNASITRALHGLHMDFRTRDEDAVLMKVVKEVDSLLVVIQNSSLVVEIRSGNGIEGASFLSQMPVSDGLWHTLLLSMEEPSAISSRWHLCVDGSINATLQGNAGSLDFLKSNTVIVLAKNFTGCLGHVDVGGVLLPLTAHTAYPQPEQFLLTNSQGVLPGCTGVDVCASSPCLHGGSCQDLFNAFSCACSLGWEGPVCEVNIDDCQSSPCIHGMCMDEVADFQCDCDKGYIGKRCQINVDDCIRHQCQNGATCVDGVYSYSCKCPPQFTGPHCEWPFPPEQCGKNFTCLNGGRCTNGPWGANCTCKPGYTGRKCQININDCDPNPCQNGGTCQDSVNRYRCVCSASYTGERCDVDRGTPPSALFPFPLIEVAVPVACGCLLLLIIILVLMILTARKRRQSEGTYSPSQQEVQPAWAQVSSSTLVGAVGAAAAAVLITLFGVSVVAMKKRRATQGTYSPSRQEKDGARVEMWNVIKLPPLERLI